MAHAKKSKHFSYKFSLIFINLFYFIIFKMSLLLLMLITTAFWVVPTDSMEKLKSLNRHSNNAKIEAILNEIFEKLASDDETIRNEGAYEILQYFTDGKIKNHYENSIKICIAKAKDFLDQILFAIKKSKVINLEEKKTNKMAQIFLAIKKNVLRSEENKKLTCAEEIPAKVKEALKLIKTRSLKIKYDESETNKNYSENIKKPFLMILSVAIRICAMVGPINALQAFLTAYKCSSLSEDQSESPPIMYSFDILPNYSEKIIGKLGHSTSEISSISLNTDISAESKQNFIFFLKLSEIELTPFSILNLAKKIEFALDVQRTNINIEHPTIYDLVIAHFYREYRPVSGLYKVHFRGSDFCNLTNFMLQLMNRVQESPNLSEYFVHAEFPKKFGQKTKFTPAFKQELDEFHNFENKYSKSCKEDNVQKVIKKHQDFLHFADAVHVNWNPYKEILIALHKFKYLYFCSKKGLEYFKNIINRFDQKELMNDLPKECEEAKKDHELMMNIKYINCLELDELMPKLQILENFEEIKQAYEYLKAFEKLFDERNCTENDEKNAFDLIVILNAELEKAKTFCMGMI